MASLDVLVEKLEKSLYQNTIDERILPEKEILEDPQKFFEWFGGVKHPRKRDEHGFPIIAKQLTWYQYEFAKMENAVMLKTNKAGVTSGEAITGDFRTRLLPQCAGGDCLLVGQNQFMADQHLLDLKRDILNSENARKWMITSPEKYGLKEEKSKMRMLYVYNPYEPDRPSRIISIGFSESLAYSWKNVNRIHISDPAQISRTEQTQFFSALYSRLSNTEGQIKIEGVAGSRSGYFWDLCRKLFKIEDRYQEEKDFMEQNIEEDDKILSSFKTMRITADDVVNVGLMTVEWLEKMRGILSESEFRRIYYTEFTQNEGAIFGDFKKGVHESLGLETVCKV